MSRKSKRFHGGYDFDFGRSRKYRVLLNTPIDLRGVPADQRDEFADKAARARLDAAFNLYGIPADSPELGKWMALATRLMSEHFKGCRILLRHPGGSPKLVGNEEYITLAEDFDAICPPKLTDIARADKYLKRHNGVVKVGREAIRTAPALIRAVKRGRALKKAEP
jgi:hypothetical protein